LEDKLRNHFRKFRENANGGNTDTKRNKGTKGENRGNNTLKTAGIENGRSPKSGTGDISSGINNEVGYAKKNDGNREDRDIGDQIQEPSTEVEF